MGSTEPSPCCIEARRKTLERGALVKYRAVSESAPATSTRRSRQTRNVASRGGGGGGGAEGERPARDGED